MSEPGSLVWIARHELRLAWRDWLGLFAWGRQGRAWAVGAVIAAVAGAMHLLAYHLVGPSAPSGIDPERTTLILVTGCALLAWSLTLSQAMEMVTRAFYAREDLDLVLSSPISARKVFAVRIAAIALSTVSLAVPLGAPFINALAYSGGPRWLGAYGVVVAMGLAATALAVALTIGLFRLLGPRRTRLVAQIIAAVVGAVFVIGVQALAILSSNTLSRIAALQSEALRMLAPGPESGFWWPARAMMGDLSALLGVVALSAAMLVAAIAIFSGRFGEHATAAAGVSAASVRQRTRKVFRLTTPARMLRRKEWTLLRRDPWLVSQTLMQVLYLLPPALLLWRNFSGEAGALVVLVPVFVMAAGQLAGGLAWLAVSGEDAPDLVATAPISPASLHRAKLEAVIGAIAFVMLPFVAAFALVSPRSALVTAGGIVAAAAAATLIQLWFRKQAKRSHFRRRQTSSRMATFAEAFSSISWAAAAGLAANGAWLALFPALLAFAVLAGAKLVSPR